MQIQIRLKALGRRRNVLSPTPRQIPDGISTLRQLLEAIARQEARDYNQRTTDPMETLLLSPEQLEARATAGRVSFGRVYSEKTADPDKAAANAVQCFADGLVRVLLEERELTDLDAPLTIGENSTFTFIRLTFLAGRRW